MTVQSSIPQVHGQASASSYTQQGSASSQGQRTVPNSYVSSREQENTNGYPLSIAPAAKLASKYGDGFVTSASHPELAQQYGNVGTSNPYADARPGTAVVKKVEKAPVSGTPLDPSQLVDMISPEDKGMTDGLLSYVSRLSSMNVLAPADHKLLMEAEKSISIFVKRLAKQDVSRDVAEKVKYLWSCLEHRDFNMANTVQNGLVNTDWREHKDWLKGLKFLIQIAAKYM
jgi:protein transport protein SEC31